MTGPMIRPASLLLLGGLGFVGRRITLTQLLQRVGGSHRPPPVSLGLGHLRPMSTRGLRFWPLSQLTKAIHTRLVTESPSQVEHQRLTRVGGTRRSMGYCSSFQS